MKIVIINNLYGKYARGGAERIVEIVVDELVRRKHQVLVILAKPIKGVQPPIGGWTPTQDAFYPWNVISYYNLYKLPKFIHPLWHLINIFNLQSYFKIKKNLKSEKPDIVMTHNLMGVGFLIPLAIRACNIKHIHTIHDIQLLHPSGLMNVNEEKKIDSFFAKIYQVINKKLFFGVGVVISPSEWLMNEHIKRGFFKKAQRVILPNPINTPSCLARKVNDGSNKFIFLYVGQIEKHKGIDVLLESFIKLEGNNVLWIVGDGKESQKSKVKSQKSKNDNIKFFGRKTSAEVQELMQKANCLIVPSLCYENQPTVIIEAVQNNLPIIASDIGGIPEMLNKKFLFKAGDIASLKNKMRFIVDNYDNIKNIPASSRINIFAQSYVDKILSL